MLSTAHLLLYFTLKFIQHHWKKKSIFQIISLSPPDHSTALRAAHHPIPPPVSESASPEQRQPLYQRFSPIFLAARGSLPRSKILPLGGGMLFQAKFN